MNRAGHEGRYLGASCHAENDAAGIQSRTAMFSLPTRILLILVTTAYGTYQLTVGKPVGIVLVAAAGLLVFGYFRYGPIRPAFVALQMGNIERVERLLSTIRFPHLLNNQSKAYLHWIKGVLDAQHADRLASAEDNLRSALNLGVRTSNDRCVLAATLAEVAAKRGDLERAKKLLDDAREIPHREAASEFIDKVRHEFAHGKEQGNEPLR